MGPTISTNITNIQQDFMNNILQQNQQNCIVGANSNANNNYVNISGAKIGGNFTGIINTVNTDASCLMVSSMDNSVSSILSATTQQTNTAATDLLSGFAALTNVFNVRQSITNNISQINEATCSANSLASSSNNYVYAENAQIKGNFVGVNGGANAKANCTMTNTMKNTTYNQAQASATQSNTAEGIFATMAGAFITVVGLIVIAVIFLYATGSLGYAGYKKSNTGGISEQRQAENAELAAAEQLGLTPDILESLSSTNFGTLSSTKFGSLSSANFGSLPSK